MSGLRFQYSVPYVDPFLDRFATCVARILIAESLARIKKGLNVVKQVLRFCHHAPSMPLLVAVRSLNG